MKELIRGLLYLGVFLAVIIWCAGIFCAVDFIIPDKIIYGFAMPYTASYASIFIVFFLPALAIIAYTVLRLAKRIKRNVIYLVTNLIVLAFAAFLLILRFLVVG